MNMENKLKIIKFTDLYAWQEGHKLVMEIYKVTKEFPKEEMYGLSNQMRRSAVSVASNIAEGKTRQSINEYVNFLYIALSSASELETQVIISKELEYIDKKIEAEILESIDHISRMTRNLIKSLRK